MVKNALKCKTCKDISNLTLKRVSYINNKCKSRKSRYEKKIFKHLKKVSNFARSIGLYMGKQVFTNKPSTFKKDNVIFHISDKSESEGYKV